MAQDSRNPALRRRQLRALTAAGAAATLAGCSKPPQQRYNQGDIDLLEAQRKAEAAASGKGPFGPHRYAGYRGLAQLPWFELDTSGQLVCVDDSVPRSIDVHCHLGMSFLLSPDIDLNKRAPRVKHLLDCDGTDPGCALDLDVYANTNFTLEAEKELQRQVRGQVLFGSEYAATQTIPNLLAEMDAMRVDQAVLLPIKLGMWFRDDLAGQWRTAVEEANAGRRLLVGGSVHPERDHAIEHLRAQAAAGATVFKLHPTVQRFYPDHDKVMSLYEVAQELGVIIFFHGGRAGIEPDSSQPYAMPRHYEAAIANFPKLQFILGHAGARDFDQMLQIALRHDNAWLGIHGQSIANLGTRINATGGERLLFGTDWPFYHFGMSLAKVLSTTQAPARSEIRSRILRDNMLSLLA